VIDEESYQSAKADLVLEKTRLKREKEQLHRTRSNYWNEPAKDAIKAFELAGKSQRDKSPQEISLVVHKVGTNRLLSRKTVTFSFSEPYDFIPSTLASRGVVTSGVTPSLCDEKPESLIWCAREDLNLQSLRNQILSLACLPIPPRAHPYFTTVFENGLTSATLIATVCRYDTSGNATQQQ
jgi:hypothetical protein